MTAFKYTDNHLTINGHKLTDIAREYGTPTYVYSAPKIIENYKRFETALTTVMPHHDLLICYATKANSHLAITKLLSQHGAGADVVMGGELYRAITAGVPAHKIVFSGVGKTRDEIKSALKHDILQINVESLPEIIRINEIAEQMQTRAKIGLRINPDITAGAHDKIATGRKDDKFGIDYDHAFDVYRQALNMTNIDITGISVHIGSQIFSVEPFRKAYQRLSIFIDKLANDEGITLKNIDLGGGIGIPYMSQESADLDDYARIVRETLGHFNARLIFEPGRLIVGDAGVLLANVEYLKTVPSGRSFVILDTGMSEIMRPALYDAKHPILPCIQYDEAERPKTTFDIVGPICESSDIFLKNQEAHIMHPDDTVAIMVSGAYGMCMASNYNTRPFPVEILCDETHITVIRSRKTFAELIADETLPDWI